MKEPNDLVFDRYIDRALGDPGPNCLSCFKFVVQGKKVRCKLTKWPGRELRDLLERREYTYYGMRAKKCGRWEGDE